MALPTSLTQLSYGDACVPSWPTGTLAGSYSSGQTFTLSSVATWFETNQDGTTSSRPLGTSGPFVVTYDFGLTSEEHILCSSLNQGTGVVTIWTDGTLNGRGYGTAISSHAAGSSDDANVFPLDSAVVQLQNRTQIATNATNIATNASAIAAEASTRSTADTTLQSNINTEATARSTADTTLQSNINTEATARATADTTNATAIASETTRATNAEALLVPLSQKGSANGVATLDASGAVPLAQLINLFLSEKQFNILEYSAQPTSDYLGTTFCTSAVTAAQTALKANGGGVLVFPAGGTYQIPTGLLTRTLLADANYAILALGATLHFTGSGIGIDTFVRDPAYWASPIPFAPVVVGTVDCYFHSSTFSGLSSGGVGIRHGLVVGAYYDALVVGAINKPDSTWPTSGNPGVRGWKIQNGKDTNNVAQFTEQTVFGPNCGVHDCYIGIEFDSVDGGNSFGYTTMVKFMIESNRAGQRGLVVRNSNGVQTLLYNSHLLLEGNSGFTSSSLVSSVLDAVVPGAISSIGCSTSPTAIQVFDGQELLLKAPAVAISAVSGANGVVTVTTSAPHNLAINQQVILSGFSGGASGYNAPLATVATVADSTHFTYLNSTTAGIAGSPTVQIQPQAVMVRGVNAVGATSINIYQVTATGTFTGGTVELAACAVQIGWPIPNSSATTTDSSALKTTSLDWHMEGNGNNSDIDTVPLFIHNGATFDVAGSIDIATYSTGLVQSYGTLRIVGQFNTRPSFGTFRSPFQEWAKAFTDGTNFVVATNDAIQTPLRFILPDSVVDDYIFYSQRPGDSTSRFIFSRDGFFQWGPGYGGTDLVLNRYDAHILRIGASGNEGVLTVQGRGSGAGAANQYAGWAGASASGHPTAGSFRFNEWVWDLTLNAFTAWRWNSNNTWDQLVAIPTGAAGGSLAGTYPNPSIANSGVVAANYGDATHVAVFIVGPDGRLTSAGNQLISGVAPGGSAGGDLNGTYPNPTIGSLMGVTLNAAVASPTKNQILGYDGSAYRNRVLQGDIYTDSSFAAMVHQIRGLYGMALDATTFSAPTTGFFPRFNGTLWVAAALVAGDIPNLSASKITSGTLAIAQGGTGASSLAALALGSSTATTQAALDNSTKLSTTAYVDLAVSIETTRATTAEALKAPLASPALTGTPTVPTAAADTNNTQAASTSYVDAAELNEIMMTEMGSGGGTGGKTAGASLQRNQMNDNTTLALTSGAPVMVAIPVKKGVPITYLGWYVGATGATLPLNHWLALLDNTFTQKAVTSDFGSAAINSKSAYGGSIAFTPTYTGVMYIAICVVATTPPTVTGAKLVSSALSGALGSGPKLAQLAAAGETVPQSNGHTFSLNGTPNVAAIPYVWAGT